VVTVTEMHEYVTMDPRKAQDDSETTSHEGDRHLTVRVLDLSSGNAVPQSRGCGRRYFTARGAAVVDATWSFIERSAEKSVSADGVSSNRGRISI